MRSPRGFLGSIVLLLALPIAVLTQVLFGSGSAVAIHVALAVGCVLVSFSAFDFGTPRWVAWIGCVSAGAFAAIFLVQAASALIGTIRSPISPIKCSEIGRRRCCSACINSGLLGCC